MRRATNAYFGVFIGLGLALSVLNPALGYLRLRTGTSIADAGILFTAQATGYLVGAVSGGRLYDRYPPHRLLAASSAIAAAVLLLVPAIEHLWLMAAVFAVVGLAAAGIDVGGNSLIVWEHGAGVGPYLNALHLCFGVGALLSPLVVASSESLRHGSAGPAFVVLAVLVAGGAVLVLATPAPPRPGDDHTVAVVPAPPWLLPALALCFTCYVGAEMTFGGWSSTYGKAIGLGADSGAQWLTAGFWGSFAFGRLCGIPISRRVAPGVILMSGVAGAAAGSAIVLVSGHHLLPVVLGTALFGASIGPLFPTMITWAERRFTITGAATSWFIGGSSLGSMVLPWLTGRLLAGHGAQAMPAVALATTVATAGALALARSVSRTPAPEPAGVEAS